MTSVASLPIDHNPANIDRTSAVAAPDHRFHRRRGGWGVTGESVIRASFVDSLKLNSRTPVGAFQSNLVLLDVDDCDSVFCQQDASTGRLEHPEHAAVDHLRE